MKQNYDLALKLVLQHEGGYTNDTHDPGGPTNWGITIYDARAYWKKDAKAADVRAMPLSVAKDIYRAKYWDAVEGDLLPSGVDYAVFDYGVNSGVSRAAKVLQHILKITADGHIGPQTVGASLEQDASRLIGLICNERLHFLKSLHTWPVFGKGWGRRVNEVLHTSLIMAEEQ